jgi:hypothetical protein
MEQARCGTYHNALFASSQVESLMTYRNRAYAAPHDLHLMIDLLVGVRPAERVADYPGIVDLQELLGLRDVQENTRLWFADDRLVGWAFVDSYDNLCFEFDPRAETDTEDEIVAWGVEYVRRKPHTTHEEVSVDASCAENDRARINFFERHGFMLQEDRVLHLACPLAAPIAAPTLPSGFSIQSVTSN